MIPTLQAVALEHHERLMWHVDHLPVLGDRIGSTALAELAPVLTETVSFLTGLLIPHMEAAERTLYPELEQLLQNRHSMSPMRREHAEIRTLVDELVRMQKEVDGGQLSTGEAVAFRRVIFSLYALLKVHLAEEQLYVGIVEHGLSAEAADVLAAAMKHAGIPEV